MVRISRHHWTSSRGLAFTIRRLESKKPWGRRGNSCILVCISSSWYFFSSCWWCLDTGHDKEELSGHRSLPKTVRCDASTNFLVQPLSFTIRHVDPNIAGMRVGENNTHLFSWHWPGDDESIRSIGTSIVDTTISQSWMMQLPVCQTPAGKAESVWAAGWSFIESWWSVRLQCCHNIR